MDLNPVSRFFRIFNPITTHAPLAESSCEPAFVHLHQPVSYRGVGHAQIPCYLSNAFAALLILHASSLNLTVPPFSFLIYLSSRFLPVYGMNLFPDGSPLLPSSDQIFA